MVRQKSPVHSPLLCAPSKVGKAMEGCLSELNGALQSDFGSDVFSKCFNRKAFEAELGRQDGKFKVTFVKANEVRYEVIPKVDKLQMYDFCVDGFTKNNKVEEGLVNYFTTQASLVPLMMFVANRCSEVYKDSRFAQVTTENFGLTVQRTADNGLKITQKLSAKITGVESGKMKVFETVGIDAAFLVSNTDGCYSVEAPICGITQFHSEPSQGAFR